PQQFRPDRWRLVDQHEEGGLEGVLGSCSSESRRRNTPSTIGPRRCTSAANAARSCSPAKSSSNLGGGQSLARGRLAARCGVRGQTRALARGLGHRARRFTAHSGHSRGMLLTYWYSLNKAVRFPLFPLGDVLHDRRKEDSVVVRKSLRRELYGGKPTLGERQH